MVSVWSRMALGKWKGEGGGWWLMICTRYACMYVTPSSVANLTDRLHAGCPDLVVLLPLCGTCRPTLALRAESKREGGRIHESSASYDGDNQIRALLLHGANVLLQISVVFLLSLILLLLLLSLLNAYPPPV